MYFILRYTGKAAPEAEKVEKILIAHHVVIVDRSGLPKMMLVRETIAKALDKVKALLPSGWSFFAYKDDFAKVPNTRRKISKRF